MAPAVFGDMNLIEGLAAVSNSAFFIRHAHYIEGDLVAWGWVATGIGTVQYLLGVAVLVKNQLARWGGVVVLGVNAVVELLLIPASPFWSLTVIALDILAMYGLIVYGSRLDG